MDKLLAKLKNAHKSWTVRFNAVMAMLIAGLPDILATLPALREYVPSQWYGYAMALLIVGNLLLRLKSNTGLEDK